MTTATKKSTVKKSAPQAAAKAAPVGKATPTPKKAVKTPETLLRVDQAAAAKVTFRGARAAWFEELVKWDGKPVAEFCAHVEANPPSLQKTGKYGIQGKCEPPMGWVKFFIRQELVTLSK
jgi:hypothetical protein